MAANKFDVDVEGVAYVVAQLKQYRPESLKALRKSMRKDMKPILNEITSEINGTITNRLQMRDYEMFHGGRTAWNGVRASTSVTSNKKGSVVKIVMTGKAGKLGFNYAELAGIERRAPRRKSKGWYGTGYRAYDYNGQGLVFNKRLEKDFGKPGRFGWIRIVRRRKQIEKEMKKILETYNIGLNRRIN